MMKYIHEIFRPLKIVEGSKIAYYVSLVINGMTFPLIQMLLSLTQKYLVNAVEFQDSSYLNYVFILSGVMIFLFLVVNPLAHYGRDRSVFSFMRKLRFKVLNHIGSLPASYFDKTHSGEILSRFNNDLNNIPHIYTGSLSSLLLALFYGIGSITVMFTLFWQLSILIIVLGFFETMIISKFTNNFRKSSDYIQKKLGLSNERFIDIIQGLRIIRMFSLSHLLLKKYTDENDDISKEMMKRNKKTLIINGFSDLFTAINLIGLLSLGVILYFNGVIDLGSVMAFLVLQDGVSYMFGNIGSFLPKIQQRLASSKRILDLLDEKTEDIFIDDASFDFKSDHMEKLLITCNKIHFKYADDNQKLILNELSCTIKPGEITAFIGLSGSGKTTLIKLLLGFYKPSAGDIILSGINYNDIPLKAIRDNISYVSQSMFIFNDTITENIRCGNSIASDKCVIEAAKKAHAHEFIIETKDQYQTILLENGSNLSGGQKQRIALARAMLKNAPVFILDEPTTAVDSVSEAKIYDSISALVNEGKIVIIIAHRISSISKANTVLKFEDGKIKKLS